MTEITEPEYMSGRVIHSQIHNHLMFIRPLRHHAFEVQMHHYLHGAISRHMSDLADTAFIFVDWIKHTSNQGC